MSVLKRKQIYNKISDQYTPLFFSKFLIKKDLFVRVWNLDFHAVGIKSILYPIVAVRKMYEFNNT